MSADTSKARPDRRFPGFIWALVLAVFSTAGMAQVSSLRDREVSVDGSVESLLDQQDFDNAVYAIGEAQIFGGNISEARERALQAAYAEAVSIGAGISVGSLTLIRNVSQITDLVTTQSRGFISSYEVIDESIIERDGSRLLRIGIEASVHRDEEASSEDRLEGLKLYLQILGTPTVLILAPQFDATMDQPGARASARGQTTFRTRDGDSLEQEFSESRSLSAGGRDYAGTPDPGLDSTVIRATEAALAQELNAFGYRTLTIESLYGLADEALVRRAADGEAQAALQLAREVGADVALIGRFVVAARRINPHGVEFEQVSIEYSSRARIVSTGEEVRTFSMSATKAHSNMLSARAEATREISRSVASEIAWEIPKILTGTSHAFDLVLSGLSADAVFALNERLTSLQGVSASRIERLPTESSDQSRLRLSLGYVRISSAELFGFLDRTLPQAVVLVSENPFEMHIRLD
jgi:hypothetical protein